MWHYKEAFEERSVCVDGVGARYRIDKGKIGHKCKKWRQKLEDYKDEFNEKTMMRKWENWTGQGPETCAIYGIEL